MVKPEWGTKRTCPKCSTRFYDLTNDNPVHCIECGTEWVPEPVLKSKQPMAFEPAAQVEKEPAPDDELAAEDLAVDEDQEISADEEVDLETGDAARGVEPGGVVVDSSRRAPGVRRGWAPCCREPTLRPCASAVMVRRNLGRIHDINMRRAVA